MFTPKYVDFRREILPADKSMQGGQLSFLPPEHHFRIQNDLEGIFIELDEFVLLELRGPVEESGFRLDLMMAEIGFWQLYQFMNTTELYLPHSLLMGDNRCISFSSQNKKIPLLLSPGRQWTLCIGYKKSTILHLLKEFPMLSTLVFGDSRGLKSDMISDEVPANAGCYWETDISINHSLREAWRRIGKTDYLPFRGKAELILGMCKLLEEYCKQLDKQADQSERSMLGLYHKALAYINENLLDSINKDMVAKGLNVSVRTLTRAFENRPIKIADYIQQLKLNQARQLLYEGEMTVEQISNLLNYPNRKYFSREFKKYFFQNPSSFQKEMAEFRPDEEE